MNSFDLIPPTLILPIRMHHALCASFEVGFHTQCAVGGKLGDEPILSKMAGLCSLPDACGKLDAWSDPKLSTKLIDIAHDTAFDTAETIGLELLNSFTFNIPSIINKIGTKTMTFYNHYERVPSIDDFDDFCQFAQQFLTTCDSRDLNDVEHLIVPSLSLKTNKYHHRCKDFRELAIIPALHVCSSLQHGIPIGSFTPVWKSSHESFSKALKVDKESVMRFHDKTTTYDFGAVNINAKLAAPWMYPITESLLNALEAKRFVMLDTPSSKILDFISSQKESNTLQKLDTSLKENENLMSGFLLKKHAVIRDWYDVLMIGNVELGKIKNHWANINSVDLQKSYNFDSTDPNDPIVSLQNIFNAASSFRDKASQQSLRYEQFQKTSKLVKAIFLPSTSESLTFSEINAAFIKLAESIEEFFDAVRKNKGTKLGYVVDKYFHLSESFNSIIIQLIRNSDKYLKAINDNIKKRGHYLDTLLTKIKHLVEQLQDSKKVYEELKKKLNDGSQRSPGGYEVSLLFMNESKVQQILSEEFVDTYIAFKAAESLFHNENRFSSIKKFIKRTLDFTWISAYTDGKGNKALYQELDALYEKAKIFKDANPIGNFFSSVIGTVSTRKNDYPGKVRGMIAEIEGEEEDIHLNCEEFHDLKKKQNKISQYLESALNDFSRGLVSTPEIKSIVTQMNSNINLKECIISVTSLEPIVSIAFNSQDNYKPFAYQNTGELFVPAGQYSLEKGETHETRLARLLLSLDYQAAVKYLTMLNSGTSSITVPQRCQDPSLNFFEVDSLSLEEDSSNIQSESASDIKRKSFGVLDASPLQARF